MKEVKFRVEDSVYQELQELAEGRGWREFFLDLAKVSYKPRKRGKPVTVGFSKDADIICDGKDDNIEIQEAVDLVAESEKPEKLVYECSRCGAIYPNHTTVCHECRGHVRLAFQE